MNNEFKWAFFGSSEFSVSVLEELERQKLLPGLVVTVVDKPKGRKLISTPNVVKVWAQKKNIKVVESISDLKSESYDVFLVASYGKIIKKEIFEMPKRGTLNIHPSLLPKYRGASPIESQILNNEKEIGVSIMLINEGVDTGPIVAKKVVSQKVLGSLRSTRLFSKQLSLLLAEEGAKLFVEILPQWLSGYLQAMPQDESKATITHKIKKEDGLLDLNDDPLKNLLKVKAYAGWPTTYFFLEKDNKKVRIIVLDAEIEDGEFKILRVIPEGKKEMPYEDFLRGQR